MTRDTPEPISTDDLHAYADGKLPAERRALVEAHLARNPEAARQVADYRRIGRALALAFDPVLEEAVPARQIATVVDRRPRWRLTAAAAAIGLLLGGVAGWSAHLQLAGNAALLDQLIERTRAAYAIYAPESRHPVEVYAAEADHLASWLSNRMDMSVRIPQLGDLGFALVGGRLMAADERPAALLMYENGEGRRLVLYIRNDLEDEGPSELRYRRDEGPGVLYWAEGSRGFGLSGRFSEAELQAAAQIVRVQYAS